LNPEFQDFRPMSSGPAIDDKYKMVHRTKVGYQKGGREEGLKGERRKGLGRKRGVEKRKIVRAPQFIAVEITRSA